MTSRRVAISGPESPRLRACLGCRRGFTLIELILVIAIVGLLLGILLPALSGTLAAGRSFKCQTRLRGIGFEFSIFADDALNANGTGRGNDPIELSPGRFRLETFQNAQYGLAEFWAYEGFQTVTIPDQSGKDPLRCPQVKGAMTLRKHAPCSQGGLSPWESVSYGFNIRLRYSERQLAAGRSAEVELTSQILTGMGTSPALIPLAWDVDGAQAIQTGNVPVYSGPSLGSQTLFTGDQFWYPGLRHGGQMSIGFLDGHVQQTRRPLSESWAWDFDPGR